MKDTIVIIRSRSFADVNIPVLSFNHGIAMPLMAPGVPSGNVVMQDFTFTKYFDGNSPLLNLLCCKGELIDEIIFQSGYSPGSYHEKTGELNSCEIYLSECYITSVSVGGGGDQPIETVTCTFKIIRWEHEDDNEVIKFSEWKVSNHDMGSHFG